MDWVPLNLADTRDALQRWASMDQRGQWICGYHQGASGSLLMGGESDAFLHGHQLGTSAYTNSMEHRNAVSVERSKAANARWDAERARKSANADAIACPNADAIEYANGMHSTRQDKQTKTEQETKNKGGKPPTRSARFIPPTESEWLEYCQKTWDNWHPSSIQSSWNHYESVGWMAGKSKIKDWRATARNAHNTAKQYGKLQPKGVTQPSYFPSKVSVHSDKPINSPFDSILKENGFL